MKPIVDISFRVGLMRSVIVSLLVVMCLSACGGGSGETPSSQQFGDAQGPLVIPTATSASVLSQPTQVPAVAQDENSKKILIPISVYKYPAYDGWVDVDIDVGFLYTGASPLDFEIGKAGAILTLVEEGHSYAFDFDHCRAASVTELPRSQGDYDCLRFEGGETQTIYPNLPYCAGGNLLWRYLVHGRIPEHATMASLDVGGFSAKLDDPNNLSNPDECKVTKFHSDQTLPLDYKIQDHNNTSVTASVHLEESSERVCDSKNNNICVDPANDKLLIKCVVTNDDQFDEFGALEAVTKGIITIDDAGFYGELSFTVDLGPGQQETIPLQIEPRDGFIALVVKGIDGNPPTIISISKTT